MLVVIEKLKMNSIIEELLLFAKKDRLGTGGDAIVLFEV